MSHFKPEAMKLYRDILRASKLFTWPNESGELWSMVLRKNARYEFEQAKYERDPLIIARLLYVGRDCLNQTTDKYFRAADNLKNGSSSS